MIVHIRGVQDCGKTATGVGIIRRLLLKNGYAPGEIIANLNLKIPGTHAVKNEVMRKFLLKMVDKGLKHRIVLIDEADRVFPARFWQQGEQTNALIGLWQDIKLFNWVIWTAHKGTGVDIILRSVTQIGIKPYYIKSRDLIKLRVYNGLFEKKFDYTLRDVSINVFPYYDRWEVIN